jgi:hypothetical protein
MSIRVPSGASVRGDADAAVSLSQPSAPHTVPTGMVSSITLISLAHSVEDGSVLSKRNMILAVRVVTRPACH